MPSSVRRVGASRYMETPPGSSSRRTMPTTAMRSPGQKSDSRCTMPRSRAAEMA